MKVTLINYTGCGHGLGAAEFAAAQLIVAKSTRLSMHPGLLDEVLNWPKRRMDEELAYIANTIPSSWEFVDYTFMIEGVTRAFTHQFVRSRHWSFAQQTMRVLDVSEGRGWDFLAGPSIANRPDGDKLAHSIYDHCMDFIAENYKSLIKAGAKVEDARGVLPTNILTNILGKANLRGVCELVRKRSSSRTQGEYRDVLEGMKEEVVRVHPWTEMFIERTFDKAANELEAKLIAAVPAGQWLTEAIKLIDQMRGSA